MGKPGKKLKKIFLILGITGAVYGGFKYLLPLVVPFLCAYLAALWLGPSVRYFERRLTIRLGGKERRIPAAVIGGAELLFMGAVLGWLFYLGSSRLLAQARLFMVRLPEWLSEADRILTGLFLSLEEKMGLMPESLVGLARELVRDASEAVRQASLPLLMTNSVSVLAWAVRAVVFRCSFCGRIGPWRNGRSGKRADPSSTGNFLSWEDGSRRRAAHGLRPSL
ncbi:MAG: AI-2E family transporter [Enterocloster sp.]